MSDKETKPRIYHLWEPDLMEMPAPGFQGSASHVACYHNKVNGGYTAFIEHSAYESLQSQLAEAQAEIQGLKKLHVINDACINNQHRENKILREGLNILKTVFKNMKIKADGSTVKLSPSGVDELFDMTAMALAQADAVKIDIKVDKSIPEGEIHFRNDHGEIVGKIVNVDAVKGDG